MTTQLTACLRFCVQGLVAATLALAIVPSAALAWGPVGHETVAYIAEDNLSPAAKNKIDAILGRGLDLAAVANWADQVRATTRPETAPWHFIDIEDRTPETEADEPKFCAKHDCVVDQIGLAVATLKNSSAKQADKLDALKFLVHFVGDVHQPLHCADDTDRGGNEKNVRYKKTPKAKGTKIKLHAYWDHLAEVKTVEDPRELASELALTDAQKQEFEKGTPADWAWESFQIARDTIYSEFPAGPTTDPAGVDLPKDYYTKKMKDIVNRQLQRAGARLAMLLSDVFKLDPGTPERASAPVSAVEKIQHTAANAAGSAGRPGILHEDSKAVSPTLASDRAALADEIDRARQAKAEEAARYTVLHWPGGGHEPSSGLDDESLGSLRQDAKNPEGPRHTHADPMRVVADEILTDPSFATLVFNPPARMVLGEEKEVVLLLSPEESEAILRGQLAASERATAQAAVNIQVLPRMEAMMTGVGFTIMASTPIKQAVKKSETTKWSWSVTPTLPGKRLLNLCLWAHIEVERNDVPCVVKTFSRDIEVEVTVTQQVSAFVGRNWQWLWATMLVPLAGFLWRRRSKT